ncbi:MAG: hypothetical protein D6768_01560 [Chloroflexi bacterium]|nr:MAG: hypothetical protein D6768_01560 [Chloroflexota bacterium]
MRVRRLQRRDEDGVWFDDAYALEDARGQVVFHYNLTWERLGAEINRQLLAEVVPLDEMERVIPASDDLRWQEPELIEAPDLAEFLAALNEACAIPKARPVVQTLAA